MNFFYEQRKNRLTVLRGELEFDAHLHSHAEVLYMRSGTCDVYIEGSCHSLKAGDCLIIFPNRIHSFRKGNGDLADVLIVSPEAMTEYKNIFSKMLPSSPHIPGVSKDIADMFNRIYEYNGDYADSVRWGYCTAIIGSLFENMEFRSASFNENKVFQRLLEYCNENYMNNISLSDVSKAVGISTSHISHLFSDKLFIGFRQYINSLRINDALKLIDNDEMTTTQIAYETGFSSIRTFNRAFVSHVGCTPSEYKKSKNSKG